ncbi:MAG: SDR family NAD(P)-dependent oxidoreductase, partial [Marmoricola sp.]
MTTRRTPPTALVTGGSSGLGLALARYLDATGWIVVTDARDESRLRAALAGSTVHAVAGDVADADHRAALVKVVADLGGLDLLVLNHSTLGPVPMRPLTRFEPTEIGEVFRTNAGAPGSLM